MKCVQVLTLLLWALLGTTAVCLVWVQRFRSTRETLAGSSQGSSAIIVHALSILGKKKTGGSLQCPSGTQIKIKEGRFFCAGMTNQNHTFPLCNPATSNGQPNPQTTNQRDALAYAQRTCEDKSNCELSVPGTVLPEACLCEEDIGFDVRYTCEPTSL